MEKKQSSIEWLIGQIIFKTEFANLSNQYILMSDKDIDGIIEQAKAMHKEEIINSYEDGHLMGSSNLENTGKQHYYEIFGGDNE